jgi:hypothetical protein
MIKGRVVMPRNFMQIGVAGVQAEDAVLPAASSRFAVHFAMNPELDVFQAYFEFCNGAAAMTALLAIRSSISRPSARQLITHSSTMTSSSFNFPNLAATTPLSDNRSLKLMPTEKCPGLTV